MVLRYRGLPHAGEEAIRIVNATPYAVHGSIWSGELDRAERVARQVRTGGVDLNGVSSTLLTSFCGRGSPVSAGSAASRNWMVWANPSHSI